MLSTCYIPANFCATGKQLLAVAFAASDINVVSKITM